MESEIFTPLQLNLTSDLERQRLITFLAQAGLRLDDNLQYYAVLYNNQGEIICGGGFDGNIIKCVAVSEEARGLGLVNTLISHLRSEIISQGADNIFVYTKPENKHIFESLAFYTVGTSPKAILLESSKRGIIRLKNSLARHKKDGLNGAIVMNANPFTLGHLYLVQETAKRCDNLYIFPVRADRSEFPYEDRYRLIEEGCASIDNAKILDGGNYIISGATFPTYFLKQMGEAAQAQAQLVLDIFARHIAPSLNVKIRFVGSEPLDPFTQTFNETMLQILPSHNIKVDIIERLQNDGQPVSASRVRALLGEGRLAETKNLVPPSTFAYFSSPAGQKVIASLRQHQL